MRISDWSLDGCSSDLWTLERLGYVASNGRFFMLRPKVVSLGSAFLDSGRIEEVIQPILREIVAESGDSASLGVLEDKDVLYVRSEEHTSELQSLMRISYAVFCLKKKK